MQDASRVRDLWYASQRAQGVQKRWRVERRRSVPSESAVFRYLERFHEVDDQSKREAPEHSYLLPTEHEGSAQGERRPGGLRAEPFRLRLEATLDMDATLV